MSIVNLGTQHINASDMAQLRPALDTLRLFLTARAVNLTADDRRRYGSVNEFNKLLINKVKDYANTQPSLASPDVDWNEFSQDYASREFLGELELTLTELLQVVTNKKILHDWDNLHAALTDYSYTQYKHATSTPGFQGKYNELKQFFKKDQSAGSSSQASGS